MDQNVLVPFIFFSAITVMVVAFFYYRQRGFATTHATLGKAIEAGQALTPEVIAALGVRPAPTSFADLRRAVLFVAFGLATAIFGQFLDDAEAARVFVGLAVFPVFLGMAYVLVYRLGKKQAGV
ncbi:MAG: DUF6249 domain-containing protein [Pseudomonadota bacterium]